jgi:hypothetical protein
MYCFRLRAGSKFADAMKKGPKGRNGKEPQKRFCIDCGLHPGPAETRYSPGAELVVEGRRHVFCKSCRKYTADAAVVGSGQCAGCHSRYGYRGLPSQSKRRSLMKFAFNHPKEFRKTMFGLSDDDSDYDSLDETLDCYEDYYWD